MLAVEFLHRIQSIVEELRGRPPMTFFARRPNPS
jgi:hypothetical protein